MTLITLMNSEDVQRAARFQALIVPMIDDAYSLARYLVRNPTAAEDIVQEACLRALRHIDSLRSQDARPWFLTIVRNCFFAVRAIDRAAPTWSVNAADEQTDACDEREWWCDESLDQADPEAILERAHDREVVQTLIAGLPLQFREVLVLRELNDLSYREIAEVTGVPAGTVMSRLARARALLRRAWLGYPGNGGAT